MTVCNAAKTLFATVPTEAMSLIYKRTATLMEAELDDEMVGLEPDAGVCYGFNNVAKRVWQLLEQAQSFEAIRTALLEEYDVTPAECESDLRELLADFIEKKLITVCQSAST